MVKIRGGTGAPEGVVGGGGGGGEAGSQEGGGSWLHLAEQQLQSDGTAIEGRIVDRRPVGLTVW